MMASLPGPQDVNLGTKATELVSENTVPTAKVIRAVLRSNPWCSQYTCKEMDAMQDADTQDSGIGTIAKAVNAVKKPDNSKMAAKSPESRHYWIIWDQFLVKEGVLYRRGRCDSLISQTNLQLVTPKNIR